MRPGQLLALMESTKYKFGKFDINSSTNDGHRRNGVKFLCLLRKLLFDRICFSVHHRTDLFDQGTVSGRGALRNLSRILFTFVQGVDLITTDIVIDISLISFYLTSILFSLTA